MRVVNLSRRPFLNRRPVVRLAILLWIAGGLLLATNAWLFAGYFSGTTKNRERLAELNLEIDATERQFDELGERLGEVSLGERNQRAAFLNDLIDQRTFPWSRLFDDLEDALSDDVYLTLVSPSVEKEEARASRPRTTQRRLTPREARERARQRRSGGSGSDSSRGPAAMPTPETANVAEESDFDVVILSLQGVARSDEALLDFVDALYQNESFVDPFLSTEQLDRKLRSFRFDMTTYYLLPRRQPTSDEDVTGDTAALAADEAADGAADDAAGEAGAGADGPAKEEIAGATTSGQGAAGSTSAASRSARRRPEQAPSAGSAGGDPAAPDAPAPNAPADEEPRASGAAAQDEESSAGDPRVRRPGTSTDRRRLDEIRSRLDSLGESGRDGSSADDARQDDGRQDVQQDDVQPGEGDEPELTEPAASATPRLRRLGALAPPPAGAADPAAPDAPDTETEAIS